MKKNVFLIMLSALLVFTSSIQVFASENINTELPIVIQEEVLENGDIIVTTIHSESLQTSLLRASTVSGSKTVEYQNSDRQTLWTFTVSGTFSINGSSVSCTKASHTISIKATGWKAISESSYASGSSANASVRMGYYSLGILMQYIDKSLTLTCDSNGNLT